MNAHALAVLEFPRVLDLVAERASSPLGAERVRSLLPVIEHPLIEEAQRRVAAVRAIAAGNGGWRPHPIPDLRKPLAQLRIEGSVWTAADLLSATVLLRSSRLTLEALGANDAQTAAGDSLAPLTGRLLSARQMESDLEGAIDPDGSVRDEASPELRRIRRELRGARSELVEMLERAMARLDAQYRVPDMSVTVRNGRFVIPVRREGRGAVGGIVHDESGTGGTLFIEPPVAVDAGNRIRELEVREVHEIQRILRELTGQLRPLHARLEASLDALVELDSLWARARFASDFRCGSVRLCRPSEGFSVVEGRHPLLLAGNRTVVPFDLEIEPSERTILLSGPNTGGKTVLLKALGLISALTQAGIPATVGEGSRVAVFDDIFADIGDEQSIQASLSTFSAHLRNLGEILERATPDSLALIDELGSGTDPAEGAALGGSILEELTRRGTVTVATTHLGALKLLATENTAIVNASLQFDEVALAPTFRFVKGIPGRSYGLGIARRLSLPQDVLARAEERLPHGERDVAALLADLEEREAELGRRESEVGDRSSDLERRLEQARQREEKIRSEQRELERQSRQGARQYLLEARAEVERIIRDLREGSAPMEEMIRESRRQVEALASEQADALAALHEERVTPAEEAPPVTETLKVGAQVSVDTLGGREGTLIELRDELAVVAVGTMKLTLPISALRAIGRPAEKERITLRGDEPELRVASEVDLRGLRVEEVEAALQQALDDAIRADLRSLRIIHGKGTGALRDRVQEVLRADPRVRAYRWGAWNEGGAGVTVAELA